MLEQVLAEEQPRGWTHVTLSVDERNAPAWKLYRDMGFEPVDSREAYIAVWR
jgi:ribosomal protein S18 acetylase RimI-like enzyme